MGFRILYLLMHIYCFRRHIYSVRLPCLEEKLFRLCYVTRMPFKILLLPKWSTTICTSALPGQWSDIVSIHKSLIKHRRSSQLNIKQYTHFHEIPPKMEESSLFSLYVRWLDLLALDSSRTSKNHQGFAKWHNIEVSKTSNQKTIVFVIIVFSISVDFNIHAIFNINLAWVE